MTEDAMKAVHQQFTATLEGLARQNVELQNELAQSRQQAANELQHSDRKSEVLHCVGRRHAFAGEAKRLLRGAKRVARLQHSVQGVRWRSDTTSAGADGQCREGDRADSQRHDH